MLWGWPFPTWELIVKVSLWLVVGAGVVTAVSAFVSGYVGYELTDAVQRASDERVAELNKEIARLSADAEASRAMIADADARALEAQAQLAKFKAPRSMKRDQQTRIAEKISAFKGTRFDIAVIPGDPEAATFLGQVSATLQSAGWEWIEWAHPGGRLTFTYTWPGLPNVGQMGGFGIDVIVHSDHRLEFENAAKALSDALAAEHFSDGQVHEAVPAQSIPNGDTIHIVIGKKPQ